MENDMRYRFLRFPDGKAKAVTFSYDDGVPQDVRLAEMFTRKGLKGTFNLNSDEMRGDAALSREVVESVIFGGGHEVAVHGAMHRAPCFTKPVEGIKDVLDCRIELEEKYDRIIRGMAYPDAGVNRFQNGVDYDTVRDYLKDLDIAYARVLAGDNNAFNLPSDFYRWMPNAHHDNPKLLDWIDEFLAIENNKPGIYLGRRFPRLLYIWGHSYEFDQKNNWDRMELITDKLADKDDIWYATNIEICDYIKAYHLLRTNAVGSIMYNPTQTKLWVDIDGELYVITPGETVRIKA